MTNQKQPFRILRYTSRSEAAAVVWQKEVRNKLFHILKLDDLVSTRHEIALNPVIVFSEQRERYLFQEVQVNTTRGRRMDFLITLPLCDNDLYPVVVCIHGHRGNRYIVHDSPFPYRCFAKVLAERGYATISTDVGQHEVYEQDRTLMGERLWDLTRCIDYLESLRSGNKLLIGCAGLSLGVKWPCGLVPWMSECLPC